MNILRCNSAAGCDAGAAKKTVKNIVNVHNQIVRVIPACYCDNKQQLKLVVQTNLGQESFDPSNPVDVCWPMEPFPGGLGFVVCEHPIRFLIQAPSQIEAIDPKYPES